MTNKGKVRNAEVAKSGSAYPSSMEPEFNPEHVYQQSCTIDPVVSTWVWESLKDSLGLTFQPV